MKQDIPEVDLVVPEVLKADLAVDLVLEIIVSNLAPGLLAIMVPPIGLVVMEVSKVVRF